jgi:hypothetical protein
MKFVRLIIQGGEAMRLAGGLIGILAILPFSASAGEKQPMRDYADFSRLVHKIVVKQLPKQFEDVSGWGQMTEVPANLRLMGLRKIIKVGDHLEAPHGAWRRFKGKIEDPDKNLKIAVKDFKKLDDKTYRIKVDVDATILCQGEWQQWQKGLLLVGADATADANIAAAIVCDVGVSFNLKKFPPELNIEPKVSELGLDLVDFKLRGDPIIKGEKGDALRNNLKEVLRAVVKNSDSFVKDQANLAIAQGLREGKGTISASAIMKALPK